MPSIVVNCPGNIPLPQRYSSFREFVEQDDSEPATGLASLTPHQVTKEAQARERVNLAQNLGLLQADRELKDALPERQKEPSRQHFHHDHLLAHTLHFRKLLQAEHLRHKADAKRVAHEAARVVRSKKPKSAQEVEQEMIELGLQRYRQVIRDIARFWTSVESEVDALRQTQIEGFEQALKMREFNEQVEKHTQMLASKANPHASNALSEDDESPIGADTSSQDSDEDSEDNMSSSETGSEADVNSDDADAILTADQLRRKYEGLAEGQEADMGNREHVQSTSPSPEEIPDSPLESVALEEVDDTLMDDDSESIDTDDGESSNSDDSIPADSDESDEASNEPLTLSSLVGPPLYDRKFTDYCSLDRTVSDTAMAQNHTKEEAGSAAPAFFPQIQQNYPPASVGKATNTFNPAIELMIDDHNSIGPSTPASRHTSITKASEGESFTSTDARADSQRPITPVKPVTPRIKTPVPCLLRGTLREYQHEGLDWLADLYANHRNGILADEMGLGKTIQSIALLAHLAVEHHVWGPHLIIVPSSVLLNWEMEFKKFCPGFKVLTYYGSQAERKQKRRGWMDDDLWHVVITSYQLVLQDQKSFKRRNWHCMILDEAHNIKNFRSQRWQTMLTFKTRARLLLTGTPLQNNLTELWSLLFFLRPTDLAEDEDEAFAGLSDFSEWFRKPVDQILDQGRDNMDDEARDQVGKLHKVIRPYLLRRLKADVEKQMPGKYEHVELCRLSKRQRQLYDGFMSRTDTQRTLGSGNYLSIINCLMQLRKVCNHPDLFETRPVTTSLAMSRSVAAEFETTDLLVRRRLCADWDEKVNLDFLRLAPFLAEDKSAIEGLEGLRLTALPQLEASRAIQQQRLGRVAMHPRSSISGALAHLEDVGRRVCMAELNHTLYQDYFHRHERPVFGSGLLSRLSILTTSNTLSQRSQANYLPRFWDSGLGRIHCDLVQTTHRRAISMEPFVHRFGCVTPVVVAPDLASTFLSDRGTVAIREAVQSWTSDPFHEARTRLSIAFPDKRLLQYDCGKLQRLDKLLRELQAGGHRALIFTQMTKVLDILEQFLSIHGHRYLRLDGSTKIEQRQILTDRFNNDTQFLAFILSSRSGGLGINLTGADTVIFYDLDWNPAMDKQCQDRCHRIGQTRDVHIYRFVSEHTIESNILRKSNQKRMLDDVVIQEGDFTTDYFNKLSVRDMLGDDVGTVVQQPNTVLDRVLGSAKEGLGAVLETAEDREDAAAAKLAEREDRHADDGDFEEHVVSHDPSTTPGAQTPRLDEPIITTTTTTPPNLDKKNHNDHDPTSKESKAKHEDGTDPDRAPSHLNRPVRDLDEWVLQSMIAWKNQDLGEIKADTLAAKTRDRKAKRKRGREHRVRRAR
jgi:helicase SWR1